MHSQSRIPFTALLLVFANCCCTAPVQAQGAPNLPQGTTVMLQLDEPVDCAHARVGQRLAFEVTQDVVVGDRVVVPAGSAALGTVARVSRRSVAARMAGTGPRLQVQLNAVQLPGGQMVPLADAEQTLVVHGADRVVLEGAVLKAFVRRDTLVAQQTASVSN